MKPTALLATLACACLQLQGALAQETPSLPIQKPVPCYDTAVREAALKAWNDETIRKYFQDVYNKSDRLNDLVVTAWNICWNIQTFGKIIDDNVFGKVDARVLARMTEEARKAHVSPATLLAAMYAVNLLHDESLTPDFYPWDKAVWK